MSDQVAIAVAPTPTTTPTNFDFTSPDITDTWMAAVVLSTGTPTDDSNAANAALCIGLVADDGHNDDVTVAICPSATDNRVSSTQCQTLKWTGAAAADTVIGVGGASTVTLQATYVSAIAGGFRMVTAVASAGAGGSTKASALMFAGVSRAYVGRFSPSTVSAHQNCGSAGFEFRPDLLIVIGANGGYAGGGSFQADGRINMGFVIDQSDAQLSSGIDWDTAVTTSDSDGHVSSNRANTNFNPADRANHTTLVNIDATGFNHILSAGAQSALAFLAIKWAGPVKPPVSLNNFAVTGSTGIQSFVPGIIPRVVLGQSTLLTSVDSATDGATAAGVGQFMFSPTVQRAYTIHQEEGVALSNPSPVTNAHTRQGDYAVLTYDETGAVAQQATYSGPTGGGFKLNFSTATAGYLTTLSIGIPPPAPGTRLRRRRRQTRARARIKQRLPTVKTHAASFTLRAGFWKAVGRIRRAMQMRLRRAVVPSGEREVFVGLASEERTKGRVFSSGMVRARVWSGSEANEP